MSVRRLCTDRRGATALEFALVAPAFIALMFGTIEFGWALHCASSVRYALERSGRELSLNANLTADQLQTAVRAQLTGIADNNVTVTLNRQTINGWRFAVATAVYNATISVPLAGDYPITFHSSFTTPTP